ncbi:putative odorant receptor 59c [Zophobas morio]|uniref:putative odorant receptor 59c n=1 Tax=Zophobas morio TaxID=2755281 RepID=UPI003083B9E8
MYPYYRPPVDQILHLFTFNGINPLKKSLAATLLVTLELTSITTTMLLIFTQFFYSDFSMKLFVDSVESLFTTSQLLVKLTTFVVKKREIKILLVQISSFWSLSQFDQKFRQECLGHLKYIKSTVKMFIVLCASVMVFFMFSPVFADRLAIICYVPEFMPRWVFVVYNSWVFGYIGMGVVAFDSFVCTMIFMLHLQYKLLNEKICLMRLEEVRNVDDERVCLQDLRSIIQFLKQLNSILGITSFIQFILYIISMCFEMYLVSKGCEYFFFLIDLNITVLVFRSVNLESLKSLFYITTLSFEMMLCFCIPSTYLTSEASKTLQVTYDTKWYECRSTSIQKNIVIMMLKGQQKAALWAGNMFVFNLETATEAFKKTLSFYTCLKTIGETT